MALIEINMNPSKRDLKWFGVLALVFFIMVGGFVHSVTNSVGPAVGIWTFGLVFCLVYYAVRPMQLVLYRGWLKLFEPLGWLIAHAIFAIIYYGAFTLIGFGLRIFRYDPMRRNRDPDAETYWVEYPADTDSSRYFRQF